MKSDSADTRETTERLYDEQGNIVDPDATTNKQDRKDIGLDNA